ncbi:MAG: TonB-dependent receptor [Acidobacteria bacterium]|nr:TonB-dependent receptor [Acidobacteriota bacterium]MBS1867387.1 TonB-dependent receptor [Acidobacteriota bacterium]
MKPFVSYFLQFLLAVFFSSSCLAQSNQSDAHLSGVILDSSGAGVGGVHISAAVEGQPQGNIWKATSTTDGGFALTLPAGKYHVVFARNSFATREFYFEFAAGESRKLDVRMELEQLSASVVVTAEAGPLQIQQTTASVDVITKEELIQRQAKMLVDALQYSPGISMGRTGSEGGTASIFLGGGNSSFTKVLVDGAPVNEPGNAVDFSNFTLDNVDKVEIVRGAESAIYGSDAVSGVVQIFTHRGTTRTPEIVVLGEGGSFGTGKGGAQISGLFGNFDYSAAGSYFGTDGPKNQNYFYNRTLSGNFGYRISEDNQLRLTLRNNTSNAQTPGQTLLEPPNLDEHTDYGFFSSNARWDFATGKHWHHKISGSESRNREFIANPVQSFYATDPLAFCPQDPAAPNAVATADFCDFTFTARNLYNRASVNAQSSFLLPNFAATGGYQYEVENASLSLLSAGHVRRNNQAGYLDFRYAPHPRASISFGARAEANGNFGTRVVPRVGVSLALLQGRGFWGETRLRAFYGEGIKEPRFDQLYSDQFGDIGNPNLKPEASKTWSAGLEQYLAAGRVKLAGEYFSNRFYNLVSFAFCSALLPPETGNSCGIIVPGVPPSSSFGYFFNTDRARARGTNLTVDSQLLRWLRVKGNYTYDDSRVLAAPNVFDPSELPGNRLARRPVNSGALSLLAGWRRFAGSLAGYVTGQRTDSDFLGLGLTRTPGYARFDFATTYNFGGGLDGFLRVQNLFDKKYQDALGYPALGREVRVGMKYRFGGKG